MIDITGEEIYVGDFIAYPSVGGTQAYMIYCIVEEILDAIKYIKVRVLEGTYWYGDRLKIPNSPTSRRRTLGGSRVFNASIIPRDSVMGEYLLTHWSAELKSKGITV